MAESKDFNPFVVEYPSGEFFVGRERQLAQLHELFDQLEQGFPCNLYVVGRSGEGKTSFLDKIVQEANKRGALAFRCALEIGESAKSNINTIVGALLREYDPRLENDWQLNERSSFRTPKLNRILYNDLFLDFKRIHDNFIKQKKFCVICIDEGNNIHPFVLSAFKNAFQLQRMNYMIVLSLRVDQNDIFDIRQAGRELLLDLANRSGDPGASRFFQNSTVLGSFDNQTEATECITKRLENKRIKFDQRAINTVIEASRANPRLMILLSHAAYNLAKESSQINVSKDLVISAFVDEHYSIIKELKEYKENLTNFRMQIYGELSNFKEGATTLEIMKKIYPMLDKTGMTNLSKPVTLELDRFCETGHCKKINDDFYIIPDADYSYALKVVLDKA